MGGLLIPPVRTQRVGQAQNVEYRQGEIVAWNPVTLENTVDVDGELFEDLPVLGVAETAGYEPGDVVGVLEIGSTWAIVGQLVVPGSAEAASALSFFSFLTKADSVAPLETTTSTTFTDLDTIGPTVEGVLIGPSGRCLLTFGAQIETTLNVPAGVQSNSGQMTFEATDAADNVIIAAGSELCQILMNVSATAGFTHDLGGSYALQKVLDADDGLEPGQVLRFRAKYKSGSASIVAKFRNRFITVQRL